MQKGNKQYTLPLVVYPIIQFCKHINDSTVLTFNLERCGLTTRPPMLNALLEATLEIGIANTYLTIILNVGYLKSFHKNPICQTF